MTKRCKKCGHDKTISYFQPAQWKFETPVCRACLAVRNEQGRPPKMRKDFTDAFRMTMVAGMPNAVSSQRDRERRLAEAAERARRYE